MEVDILCPLYNASKNIEALIQGLNNQKNIEIKRIIFPVTDSVDDTYDLALKIEKAIVYKIDKSEFSHSLTREMAVRNYAISDIIIFLTQDVILSSNDALYQLAKCIDNDIIHSFARQTAKEKGIEKYIREVNYPNESYIVSKEDIKKLQIKAFFSSDACAAYDRKKFMELGGFDLKNFRVNEDMYYCRKALLSGYKIKYSAEAQVCHSHSLSLKQIYNRYYDIGLFFNQNPEFKLYRSTSSGMRLFLIVLFKSIIKMDISSLVKIFPNMFARYIGKKRGEKNN